MVLSWLLLAILVSLGPGCSGLLAAIRTAEDRIIGWKLLLMGVRWLDRGGNGLGHECPFNEGHGCFVMLVAFLLAFVGIFLLREGILREIIALLTAILNHSVPIIILFQTVKTANEPKKVFCARDSYIHSPVVSEKAKSIRSHG